MGSHHHHKDEKNIKIAFFLNVSFTIIEVIGGLLTNSIAILADALHDLGDSLSLGLAWYFQRFSKKGRDEKYSYGYKRFSLLGAIINAIILFGGSIFFLTQSIPRLFNPQVAHAPGMMALAVLGIIVNGIAVLQLRKGNTINEKVVALHLFEDVLGWVAVLIGAIVMHFYNLPIIDPILSIGISAYILINVYKNVKETVRIILQSTPTNVDMAKIQTCLENNPNVNKIHNLHVWSIDGNYNILTANVVVDKQKTMEEIEQIKHLLKTELKDLNIHHPTLEFETNAELCEDEA
jgi:cobalt-zinc-cadmium efflux system protein